MAYQVQTTHKTFRQKYIGDRAFYGCYGLSGTLDDAQIRALRSTWTSEDGNAYIAKIETYYEDFTSMYSALNKAANALETDAAAYENTVKANMV